MAGLGYRLPIPLKANEAMQWMHAKVAFLGALNTFNSHTAEP